MDNFMSSVNELLLKYTPEYHHIKQIAEQDLGKELIERIEQFLEDRKKEPSPELQRISFDDASKVEDREINSIVDAFIRLRSGENLDSLEKKSIDEILILFNQWIMIGKSHPNLNVPGEVFTEANPISRIEELALESEVRHVATRLTPQYQITTQENIYERNPEQQYSSMQLVYDIHGALPHSHEEDSFYLSKSQYKLQ